VNADGPEVVAAMFANGTPIRRIVVCDNLFVLVDQLNGL
jgi:hypothetical protein